ncbi:NAD-dependent epimerase/dehydratase family protein (plasmid) [Streptomyces sp. NBC_01267]|uniref:NAD-dependent epimerase/dehydratase family protein n=1 Tax=unclassified Streptomyces TaxID=2593676 RepID=UPI00202499FB|nr:MULTISPECIES: NAD-dependent epimerase/dehydratase family protein [unclassified Streptomyces]WSC25158.1 NAD-dependent epimerase/dehydratase family protein [Streptomyces sp. NBC_01766]WSV58960.1 NAD-dependent epimerase/dehydratase family protein [Streptomyces sp. NBC_01014]
MTRATRLLIVGSSGFVGGHTVRAAARHPQVELRLARRQRRSPAPGEPRLKTVHADLNAPETLHGLCADVDALIHCASAITGSEEELHRVNDLGTRALVDEAVRCGVRRIVYVSTASVYGRGTFRAARAAELTPAPLSPTSRTRAAAERHVLESGGTVLRPHLVHGQGDRWMIPGTVQLLRALRGNVAGAGLQSLVPVTALAAAAVAAALTADDLAGAHHVSHPDPVSGAQLTAAVADQVGLPQGPLLDLAEARARLADSPVGLHHLAMLSTDHWFADEGLWDRLGCDPGRGFLEDLPDQAPWYREFLGRP